VAQVQARFWARQAQLVRLPRVRKVTLKGAPVMRKLGPVKVQQAPFRHLMQAKVKKTRKTQGRLLHILMAWHTQALLTVRRARAARVQPRLGSQLFALPCWHF
jgi:hypothetical protein